MISPQYWLKFIYLIPIFKRSNSSAMNRVSLCSQRKKNRSQFDNLILERTLLVWWPFINNRDSARVFFLFGYKLALVDRFHRIFSQSSTCALFLLRWHFRKICTTAFAERRVRLLVCWQILTICSWTHWVRKSIKQWRLQMVDIWKGQLLLTIERDNCRRRKASSPGRHGGKKNISDVNMANKKLWQFSSN